MERRPASEDYQFAILVLLGVIASVLLYGREATLSSIQNAQTVAVVLVLSAIALALLYWVLKQIVETILKPLGNGLLWLVEAILRPFDYLWYSVVEVHYPRTAGVLTSSRFLRVTAKLLLLGFAVAWIYAMLLDAPIFSGRIDMAPNNSPVWCRQIGNTTYCS